MGCASSSPLINGGGPGGVVESAKEAATKTANDVLHAGEAAIHDVGEHMKDAVQNVTHEIENVLGGKKDKSDHVNEDDQPTTNGHGDADNADYQIIRLKGSKQNSVEETEMMENMKNDLLTKAQSFGDDPDRMADALMKETEDLLRDAETGIEMTTRITSSEDGTIEILNLEEPEIERILAGADGDDSPKATLNTLTVPASSDEGMPMGTTPQAMDKPDLYDPVRPTPQVSIDGESMSSHEEYFRAEVLKATSTLTPGRTVARRPNNVSRPPPPSTAASDRVQRFIFKLNSIILSDIEERVDEDGSIVRQLERNPDQVVELLSKPSVDGEEDSVEDADEMELDTQNARRRTRNGLQRQQSVAVEGNFEMDSSLDHDHGRTVLLKNIPPEVRLRALKRFQSFDGFDRESVTERKSRRRMKSLDDVDIVEEERSEPDREQDQDDGSRDIPYDPEEEERICEELLEELRALELAENGEQPADDGEDVDQAIIPAEEDHRTALEKLQEYLQRVPRQSDGNYDLLYEDTLKTVFKRHRLKVLYSDSTSGSTDTL